MADAHDALATRGARWEGSLGHGDDPPHHHRLLVGAPSGEAAVSAAAASLGAFGSFGEFDVAPVRDLRGEVWQTPIRTLVAEIDWSAVASRERLTGLQRTLVQMILDAAEPTWKLLEDADVPDDRDVVEAAMKELEARSLVASTWEASGETGARGDEMCRWWSLSDEGWDLLGLIKSPAYR